MSDDASIVISDEPDRPRRDARIKGIDVTEHFDEPAGQAPNPKVKTIRIPQWNEQAVRSGLSEGFAESLLVLAELWARGAGHSLASRPSSTQVAALQGTAFAGLLAAAIELRDLISKSPQGRKALSDFGFEPVLEHVEGE